MAKIYLSSTYKDLKDCRDEVCQALRSLAGQEVRAMEDYIATDQRPLDKCLADVDWCDIYIGIFAWRYGFAPKEMNPNQLSITELEYLRAKENGKACLLFLLDKDAAWLPSLMDSYTKESGQGAQIERLRQDLENTKLVSHFKDKRELAGKAGTAVSNWEKQHRPPDAGTETMSARGSAQPQLREVIHSILLLCSPLDEDVVQSWAKVLSIRGFTSLVSPGALFADQESKYQDLEKAAIQSHTCAAVLSPSSLDQLKARGAPAVGKILDILSDRCGYSAAVCAGIKRSDLPVEWKFTEVLEAGDVASLPAASGEAVTGRLVRALESRLPDGRQRTIGLPVLFLAMTSAECRELSDHPELIKNRLGAATFEQFEALCRDLKAEEVPWSVRYADRREDWRPFAAEGPSAATILLEIAGELNEPEAARLRQRTIKIQCYSFNAVLKQDPLLRKIYRNIAQTGCILIIDELSMFHPVLREGLMNSAFFNSPQVAIVTVSPFDPGRFLINKVLEHETRRKLAGAFDRFNFDYDPLCEFAVDDERRLKRWLHTSLPETMKSLRDPRPNRDTLRQFADGVGGDQARRGIGDAIWSPGGQS